MLKAKAKNAAAKRFLESREPQVIENDKTALFLRNTTANQTVTDVLSELASLKKPLSLYFKKKENFRPFEDETSLEFLCKKNDAALFAVGMHSKKRPNCIVLGRMFDHSILDMVEMNILQFKSLMKQSKMTVGSKPLIIFQGSEFEQSDSSKTIQNMFLDFFRGVSAENVCLSGLETLITITMLHGKIHFRAFNILMKKSGTRLPRIELEPMGPVIDFSVGRTKFASDEMRKASLRKPKELKPKKVKNVSHDGMGDKLGRIHVGVQDLNKLQTRKVKGLKRSKPSDPSIPNKQAKTE